MEMQIFKNETFGEVRVTEVEGKVMFVASDVAKALGYSNPRKAVGDHCKGVTKRDGVSQTTNQYGITTNQVVPMSFIPESDVIRLIMRSKLPTAEQYQDWVFEEVLPAIHKHGGYLTPQKLEESLMNPDTIIKLAQNLKNEMEARRLLQVQNTGLIQENKQLLPHAEYCKTVLTSTSTYVTDQIAKEMGMTATALNKKLKELDVQFKRGKQWVLTSKYCDKGYTSTNTFSQTNNGETRTYMNTVWTERGRKFIHEIISNLK